MCAQLQHNPLSRLGVGYIEQVAAGSNHFPFQGSIKHEALGIPLPEWRRAYYPMPSGPGAPAAAPVAAGGGPWPYGRPGYGAPLRDVDGNVVTGFTHAVSRSPAAEVFLKFNTTATRLRWLCGERRPCVPSRTSRTH